MGATAEILGWLKASGLAARDEAPAITSLTGGVSSDVFRVDLRTGPICVKAALDKLRVAADWRAPVERSANEANYLRAAADLGGLIVPSVLAEDAARHIFAMSWFEPAHHPVWKAELAAGRVDPTVAQAVGGGLARIHGATAGRDEIAARFDTTDMFEALRLEPYLAHTAKAHPLLAGRIEAIAETTRTARLALVHGDVSPKNILVGPAGPVLLDAECAWYGDPAFDIAFCANHLLLKAVWKPAHAKACGDAFDALVQAYLSGTTWEPAEALERRAAPLLAALLLARIDGKSPVEYLTADADKTLVRDVATGVLTRDVARFADVRRALFERLGAR
ncbi:phosphotransferase [Phenylobacterium sp. VNQ135]|uniref:phosphotransferase n=1 Tax=Phenylobacterium sp. VNQ135 TaxID=3400922 RepID=UPI003BFD82C3